MVVKCTADVRLDRISPPIAVVISILAAAPIEGDFWITAIQNGSHMHGSEHDPEHDPDGLSDALDGDALGTKKNATVAGYLREYLPPTYDVLLEDEGEANEHVHVEHDPPADGATYGPA